MKRLFVEHPATVGETYFEHLMAASSFGFHMIVGGIACLLHGLFPFLCVKTGSKAVDKLHHRMVTHRRTKPLPEEATVGQESTSALERA
ncbi:MAG: DUF6356 family protein [Pseudomonadota bacterium]